ncbi:MAG TPA: class I SAM-dependent methyltransferase [Tepidisphaeraceae bacterium]|jgi:SAM-dependent methyltransferase
MSQAACVSPEPKGPDWEAVYRHGPVEQLPWFYPQFDPDMAWAFHLLDIRVPCILDLGTGPGTQAIELARRGFDVTGTDISATVIAQAQRRAAAMGVACKFFQDDILHTRLDRQFDIVIDRGCLHVFAPPQRPEYITAVEKLIRTGGHLLLKCFSSDVPGNAPPYRFAPSEVVELFRGSPLRVCDIRFGQYQGQMDPPPRALFCVLRKG